MKHLPKPGEHVVWPMAPATVALQQPLDLRLAPPTPPPAQRGLARLRRAPGAEGVRLQVVAQQQAAMAAERAAPHYALNSVLPVRKGSAVRCQRSGRRGKVLHTHVRVRTGGGDLFGHVVHWSGDDVELVMPRDLEVIA